MIQLQFLELTKKRFPDLHFNDHKDIIKLEKILKAEAKLDAGIGINDIENLVAFLKTYGDRFLPLLQDKNIAKIVKGDGQGINVVPFKGEGIDEETIFEFQQVFNSNILAYLKNSLRQADWNNIRYVFMNYRFLVSEETKDDICEALSLKNQAIIHSLRNDQYAVFIKDNAYASEVSYFSLLSVIDEYYFEEDILKINNIIAEKQKSGTKNMRVLGKILYALTYYEAYSNSLAQTLANNQAVAYGWISPTSSTGSFQWSTTNIIIIVSIIAVMICAIVLIPGSTGAGVALTIFITRLIMALRKK